MVKQYDFTESKYYPPGEEGGGKRKRNQDEDDEGGSSKTMLIAAGVVLAAVLVSVLIYVLCVTDVIPMSQKEDESPISIKRRLLGKTSDGQKVYNYRMRNPTNMQVEVLNLGSIINIVKVHDKDNKLADVVLGFHTVEGYETNAGNKKTMLGALIGQVAGPISGAEFQLNGKTHNLTANAGDHHMNGGEKGWDKFVWDSRSEDDHVRLTRWSAGSEGYPGNVTVTVTVQLTVDNQTVINITATTNETTVINPTSNICLNLGGEGSGPITDHEVTVFADQYLKTSGGDVPIPTGEILDVNATMYDLRSPVILNTKLKPESLSPPPGIDQYYILRGSSGKKLAARVKHVPSGRQVEVYTNQPGVRFYTGDKLSITDGKWAENGNHEYGRNSGFCFNSENYPDAVNQPGFPDSHLSPGSTYIHSIWYKFSAIEDKK